MSAIATLIKAPARKILSKVPASLLVRVEDLVQRQLGKGSGAWSTSAEAIAIGKFIKQLKLDCVIAIDAGANIGNWSAEILKLFPEAEIFAFEPSTDAFQKLSARFKLEKNVHCFNLALGKSPSTSTLYADKSGSGLGSLTKRRVAHFNIDFQHHEEVQVKTLDGFLSSTRPNIKPNVLKMDVEGHELDILQGAAEALSDIKIIQFEFGGSNIDTRTFFQDFWYLFKTANFKIYRLTPSGPLQIKNYSEQDETFRATNFIAIKTS